MSNSSPENTEISLEGEATNGKSSTPEEPSVSKDVSEQETESPEKRLPVSAPTEPSWIQKQWTKDPTGFLTLPALVIGIFSVMYTYQQTSIQKEALQAYKLENEQRHSHLLRVEKTGEFLYRVEALKTQDESQVLSIAVETTLRDQKDSSLLVLWRTENHGGSVLDLEALAVDLVGLLKTDQGEPAKERKIAKLLSYTYPLAKLNSAGEMEDHHTLGYTSDFFSYTPPSNTSLPVIVHRADGMLPLLIRAQIYYLGRQSEVQWLFSLPYHYVNEEGSSLPVWFGNMTNPIKIENEAETRTIFKVDAEVGIIRAYGHFDKQRPENDLSPKPQPATKTK